MANTRQPVRQGDIMFVPVDVIPDGVTKVAPESDGRHILAHSETGHHHVMEAARVDRYEVPDDLMVFFIDVKAAADLVHLRDHDTHETIRMGEGAWRVHRQREYTPEGWRRVED